MKLSKKRSIGFMLLLIFAFSLNLVLVNADTKTITYDSGAETIYDIISTIESKKLEDGNHTLQVEIKIKSMGPSSICIYDIEIYYRIDPYNTDFEYAPGNLTANGMSSTAILTFEYNTTWGNVELDVKIEFTEKSYLGEAVITHYYETNWINVFTIKPASGASFSTLSVIAAAVLLGSMVYIRTKRSRFKS